MFITSLQGLEQSQAVALLVEAALRSGPHLSSDSDDGSEQAVQKLLNEIRSSLGIDSEDKSASAVRRIDDAISEEIDRVAFSEAELSNATDDLAGQGDLPLSAYSIVFPPHSMAPLREKENFVRRSITTADIVQHLNPVASDVKETKVTLGAKKIGSGPSSHWLLMQANRMGRDLHVIAAWRVFPDVISLDAVHTPLELLRKFTSEYGVELQYDDHPPSKLFEEIDLGNWHLVKHKLENKGKITRLAEPFEAGVHFRHYETGYRFDSGKKSMLSLAYAINMKQYLKDKLSHKV